MFKKIKILIVTVFILSVTCLPASSDQCTDECWDEFIVCIQEVTGYCAQMCYGYPPCMDWCMSTYARDCVNELNSCFEDECGVPGPY